MAKSGYEFIYDIKQNNSYGYYEYWHVSKAKCFNRYLNKRHYSLDDAIRIRNHLLTIL